MVAGDDITLFIHAEATVGIAIVGKTNIQTLFHHELLQALDVGGASIVVDVQSVGLCIDDVGISAQCIEHRLGDGPTGTVGAVQTHLDALEGVDAQTDEVAHVAVAAGHVVHGTADVLPVGEGQLRPVLVKDVELAVEVILHQQQGLFGHLLAVAVDELDAVIVVGVVAGGDHNATIKVIHTCNVGHGRSGSDVQQVGICAGSGQASDQTVFEHVRAAAGILADDDAGRVGVAIPLPDHVVIPAEEAAHLICVVSRQRYAGLAAETIGPKVFSHNVLSLVSMFYINWKECNDFPTPYIIAYWRKRIHLFCFNLDRPASDYICDRFQWDKVVEATLKVYRGEV